MNCFYASKLLAAPSLRILNWLRSSASLLTLMTALCLSFHNAALAKYPFTQYSPPYTAAPIGQPPAIGSGSGPAPVTAGDSNWQPAPSGTAQSDPVNGTNFPTQSRDTQPKVNLLMAVPGRGTLNVLTFSPSSLTSQQLGQVEGVIGGVSGGGAYQDVTVDEGQLKQMQDILYPYPQTGTSAVPMRDGRERSWISTDSPGQGYPKYESSPQFEQEKPTFQDNVTSVRMMAPRHAIRVLCRYLVILGAVVACIFMIFAATSVLMGHRNAGQKVISTASGLVVLLMAYSIWKVVMVNTWNARPINPNGVVLDLDNPGPPLESRGYSGDTITQKAGGSGTGESPMANTPQAPGSSSSSGRSGPPIRPPRRLRRQW